MHLNVKRTSKLHIQNASVIDPLPIPQELLPLIHLQPDYDLVVVKVLEVVKGRQT
jgi:hypothetical protein